MDPGAGGRPLMAAGDRGARFSACERFRYRLWRYWPGAARMRPLVCLMLNPSTADAELNDPTVERCERRARALGFCGLEVVNLFALRSTDPRALRAAADPIGPENDAAILAAAAAGGQVLAAWGRHGRFMDRDRHVRRLLEAAGVPLFCLGVNQDGTPVHPLYQPSAAPLVPLPEER
jgi:hypothetical protein